MAGAVKGERAGGRSPAPPKRRYDASRRQAQARATERHIAEVARDLFLDQGYGATSVRDIAEAAGVAVQTIYNLYEGKPAIVSRIADMAVVGDDEPVALAEREEVGAIMVATDAGEVIDRWVELCIGIFDRFLPLLPMLRQASATDATVAAMWRANAVDRRYEGTIGVAAKLAELQALPAGMTVDQAADLMFSLVSFDSAEALVVGRGWTTEAYTRWMAHVVRAGLGVG